MTYAITKTQDYYLIEFKGDTSFEENNRARQELVTKLNNNSSSSVLVDMTQADLSAVTLDDLRNFGKSWEGLLVCDSTKFATLVPYENPFRNKVDLSLWVGQSKGVKLKIFEEESLAIQWLNSKEPGSEPV